HPFLYTTPPPPAIYTLSLHDALPISDAQVLDFPRAQLAAEHVAQATPVVGEIARGPEDGECVNPQPEILLQPPIEQRPEHDGQSFDAIEGSAGRDRQRRAGGGGAPRHVRAGVREPAPQVWGVGDLIAFVAQA